MGILAADKRFASVLRQELLDRFHCRIHLAFHVAGIIVTAVVDNPLVMHQAGGIFLPVEPGHLIDILAAEGFISAGPDQNRRMVFISLVHGIYPVQHHIQPFRMIAGYHPGEIRIAGPQAVPGSVGLQIVFRDHVKPVFVTQIINAHRIRIMTGTDGVDIVLLHSDDILHQFLPGYAPSCPGTELMAVHAFKHDTFSVKGHDMILHLKTAEAYPLGDHLCQLSLLIIYFQGQIIQIGFLRAPQKRLFHLHHIDAFLCQIRFQCFHCFPIPGEGHTHLSCLCGLCHDFQIRMGKGIVQQRPHPQIRHMDLRNGVQIHIPVNTGEPEEILVLAPAAAGPLEHLRRQFIFSILQVRRQLKLGRCEAVLTVAHKLSVQPYGNAAFRPLEGDVQRFPLHILRHFKILHIAGHRIEAGGNLSRLQFLMALPGILHIGVLGRVISFHLDMGRYPDIVPRPAAVIFLFKSRNRTVIIFCVMKFPQTVQTETEAVLSQFHGFSGRKISVIGMCRYPSVTEISRILHQLIIKCLHRYPP